MNTVPVLARRLEWSGHVTSRDGTTRAVAKLWDTPFTVISEGQLTMLDELRSGSAVPPTSGPCDAMLDLAARGIIDLITG